MQRFQDRVALVTGGASGIGLATCEAFAREGARVAVVDLADQGGPETAERVASVGGEAMFLPCDVSKPEQVQMMIADIMERWGRLDCAVNNAGIGGPQAPVAEYTVEDWQKVMGVNLNGVFHCMKYEIQAMLTNGGGSIVNVASILGHVAFPRTPAYTASKHALLGLSQTAAVDYAPRLRVNCVDPGFIQTPMLTRQGIEEGSPMFEMVVGKHPIGRLGRPEEVAAAILFLSSKEASFITGTSLLVDGGYTAV